MAVLPLCLPGQRRSPARGMFVPCGSLIRQRRHDGGNRRHSEVWTM